MVGVVALTDHADVLASGSERLARSFPVRQQATALLLACLGVFLVGVDAVVEDRSLERLVATVAAAERASSYAQARVAAVIAYASPQLTAAATPPAVRRSLQALVQQTARTALPETQRRLSAIDGVRVPPWHPALRRARAACRGYLRARVEELAAVAASYEAYGQPQFVTARARSRARAALVRVAEGRVVDRILPARLSP